MPAKFDLNDSSVVVIIGSGAGGGTLANELAQKGISSVVLEAGKRLEISDFKNDEDAMFGLFTWLDPRTTSGSWYVAKTSPDLPAWTCKLVGGTTVHWGACALRMKEYEFKPRTRYGEISGANLLDWPIDLHEMEPYYDRAELKMGVTGTHGIPRLPASNHGKVLFAGAKKIGYTKFETTNMAINPVPRDGRASCQQTGFCVQGCTFGAKWSTLYTEIPKAEATGKTEVRSESQVLRIEHDAFRKSYRRGLRRWQGRHAASEGAHRRARRKLNRESAPVAQLLFEQIPARPGEFFRPRRQELHAPYDVHRIRDFR